MRFEFGDVELEVEVSLRTLVIYEHEFGSDMIQDMNARETLRKDSKDPDVVFSIDYRDFQWMACLRALWAGVKTANGKTPGFEKWCSSLGDAQVDLWAVMGEYKAYVNERLFHSGATDSE